LWDCVDCHTHITKTGFDSHDFVRFSPTGADELLRSQLQAATAEKQVAEMRAADFEQKLEEGGGGGGGGPNLLHLLCVCVLCVVVCGVVVVDCAVVCVWRFLSSPFKDIFISFQCHSRSLTVRVEISKALHKSLSYMPLPAPFPL
jgi:hypothetical protein